MKAITQKNNEENYWIRIILFKTNEILVMKYLPGILLYPFLYQLLNFL